MTPQAPPAEDWYVGVGGVPLGPVRLSVIREKAAGGAVDGESLVWREGFDEWVPLKTFPGLLAMVDEAKAHPIIRPTPVPGSVTPAPRNGGFGSGAASYIGATPTPNGARPVNGSVGGSAELALGAAALPAPIASNGPIAAALAQAPLGVLADPFSLPKPAAPAAAVNGGFTADPKFAADLGLGTASVLPPASIPPPRKERKVPPIAWAFIAMCAAFGGVAAWAIFLHKPESPITSGTAIPTSPSTGPLLGPAPPPPGTVNEPQLAAGASASPSATVAAGGSYTPLNGGPGPARTSKPGETGSPIDRGGFGSPGPGGPSATDTPPDSGKGQLTEGEISGVVNRNKPGISRRCWDPAFDASDGHAKSAKVTASVTIGPSGSVQSVSASGGDAFPGLASCVAGNIRGWQFPPSDGSTPTVIPFGFNRQ